MQVTASVSLFEVVAPAMQISCRGVEVSEQVLDAIEGTIRTPNTKPSSFCGLATSESIDVHPIPRTAYVQPGNIEFRAGTTETSFLNPVSKTFRDKISRTYRGNCKDESGGCPQNPLVA